MSDSSKNNRTLTSIYHTETDCNRDSLFVTFYGKTPGGSKAKYTIVLSWWVVPLLLKSIRDSWLFCRASRLRSINQIDKALGTNEASK